jgi:hypothetical protein
MPRPLSRGTQLTEGWVAFVVGLDAFGVKKNLLPLPGIEQFLRSAALSLFIILETA